MLYPLSRSRDAERGRGMLEPERKSELERERGSERKIAPEREKRVRGSAALYSREERDLAPPARGERERADVMFLLLILRRPEEITARGIANPFAVPPPPRSSTQLYVRAREIRPPEHTLEHA